MTALRDWLKEKQPGAHGDPESGAPERETSHGEAGHPDLRLRERQLEESSETHRRGQTQ